MRLKLRELPAPEPLQVQRALGQAESDSPLFAGRIRMVASPAAARLRGSRPLNRGPSALDLCPDRSAVGADGTCGFPYAGFRAPDIGDYSAFDRDGNKLDDRLDSKLAKLSPSDRITVIVDLFEPPTQSRPKLSRSESETGLSLGRLAMLDHPNNSGGTLQHVYRYAGSGFSEVTG